MDEHGYEHPTIPEALYAKVIGEQVLDFLRNGGLQTSVQMAEGDATQLLERIRTILNDRSLDDPECFLRMEELVDAFGEAGTYTSRHDW